VTRHCWCVEQVMRQCWYIEQVMRHCWCVEVVTRQYWYVEQVTRQCWSKFGLFRFFRDGSTGNTNSVYSNGFWSMSVSEWVCFAYWRNNFRMWCESWSKVKYATHRCVKLYMCISNLHVLWLGTSRKMRVTETCGIHKCKIILFWVTMTS